MQTSSHSLTTAQEQQLLDRLYTLCADLHHPDLVKAFFADFLTDTERLVFAKRLAIAYELNQGKSYEEIKTHLKVSSATISSVAENKQRSGWQLALEKIALDDWASGWLTKLSFWSQKKV